MAPHTTWGHLSSPTQIRQRAQTLAAEHTNMLSELVEIRKSRGMTQRDVAAILGTSQQNVSKLESYDANPRLDTLRTYANAIGAVLDIDVKKDNSQEDTHRSSAEWGLSVRLPGPTSETTPRFVASACHWDDWTDMASYSVAHRRHHFALSA